MDMVTEHIIILELIAFLVVVVLVSVVIWRDKSDQLKQVNDLNEELLAQLEELQSVTDERKEGDDVLHKEIDKITIEVDQQLLHSVDDSADKWEKMEYLEKQKGDKLNTINELLASEDGIEKSLLEKKLNELEKLLKESQKKIKIQMKEIQISRKNTKGLRAKLKDLSKKILKLGSLEVKEARLKQDKENLRNRVADFKDRLESQKIINQNLENELKTSFRASEVQDLKDNLKKTEENLRQALTEKKFIEQHFIDLEENNKDEAELHAALQRANREIQMLEKTVMELDDESS